MKVFLAGAAGAIGRRLTPLLIKAGHHVTGTTRSKDKAVLLNELDQLQALPDTYSSDAICFGIRKGNPDLLRWLDLFASNYVSSGQYEAAYAKWWGEAPPVLTPIW